MSKRNRNFSVNDTILGNCDLINCLLWIGSMSPLHASFHILTIAITEVTQPTQFNKGTGLNLSNRIKTNLILSGINEVQVFL